MNNKHLVRELEFHDIEKLVDYWLNSPNDYLRDIGVDTNLLPNKESFSNMLIQQISLPIKDRNSFCLIWELNGEAIGHSNTNPTFYKDHAFMHLHIWDKKHRNNGLGELFLKLSIEEFFVQLKLDTLYSQPKSNNEGANKLLKKLGFELLATKTCVPGSINYEQEVNLWSRTM